MCIICKCCRWSPHVRRSMWQRWQWVSCVCCQKCWSLLTQTLELSQVFCDANTTDKSITTWIWALNRNTDSSLFPSTCLPRGAAPRASRAGLRFTRSWKVWREQEQLCGPTTALLHLLATSKEPPAPRATPGWASTPRALIPHGTQGPRSHRLMSCTGWEETRTEGKTPELGTA